MNTISTNYIWIIIVVALWTVPWKMVALYRSARNGRRGWFAVLFFVNTLAILEIIYIFIIDSPKKNRPQKKSTK